MKKKYITFAMVNIVAVILFYSFTGLKIIGTSKNYESISPGDTFTNCIFNTGYSEMIKPGNEKLMLGCNLDSFKDLNFNSIQWYDWAGSEKYGNVENHELELRQITDFQTILDSVRDEGLLGFYERSYLSYYCYGQRLIYEVSPTQNDTTINDGFVYKNCYNLNNNYTSDSGRTVLHLVPNIDSEDTICSNIYENLQHSDLFEFRHNEKGMWYIKPVMRIPDTISQNLPVLRIEVISFNGTKVKEIIINTDNFKDDGFYNGQYIEKYFDLQFPLEISGNNTDTTCLNYGRDEDWWEYDDNCKIDFRVYWYGQVELWFDKTMVDDETANKLFDPLRQVDINYRITQEVTNFTDYMYSFFMDEITYSQIPCMQYVMGKMHYYNSQMKFSFALTNYLHIRSLKNDKLSYRTYYDSLQPDFIQLDAHKFLKFSENDIGLPEVITEYDPAIPPGWLESVSSYNNKLQNNIFGTKNDNPGEDDQGSLLYEIYKLRNSNTNPSSGIKFIYQPQLHGYYFRDINQELYIGGLREPTNEELQAQTMLSISHGADGLCWFYYSSEKSLYSQTNNMFYSPYTEYISQPLGSIYLFSYGLLDTNFVHRNKNCYHQDKWEYVSEMNDKLKKWTEILNNTDWQGGYSVHSEGAGNEYISDIKSIKRNSYSPYNFSETNIDTVKYWEEGFFEPKVTSVNDRSKYFLMVNRRCIPEAQSGTGDIRWLKIRFNSSSLSEFRNWKLEDVYTGESLIFNRLDTTSGGYVDLGNQTGDMGYFLPGEGKLFKLAPVIQEGGTLVCDEYLSSGSINCDSTVYNNGFDITINKDVTISFSSKGEIVMEGGEFKCGLDPQMSQNRVEFKGNNGNWKGISLTNCSQIIILESDFKNIAYNGNDSTSRNSAVTIINSYDFIINQCNFEMSTSSGGVNILITSFDDVEWGNAIIQHSTFTAKDGNNQNAVSVSSLAEIISPVRIENCIISADNTETITTGIQCASVVQGTIKNNDISSCLYALDLINSSADIYENTITCGFENSSGIRGKTGSSLFLNPNDCYYTGGKNSISQTGENNKNIEVIDSYFYLDEGENTFNIGDYYSGDAYYLYGNMPTWTPNTNQTANCFKKEGNNIDIEDTVNVYCCIEDLSGDTIDFTFTPFDCEHLELENFIVISFPEIVNDTIYKTGSGMGGGFKSEEKNTNMEISPEKLLRDSINLGFRMRNYIQIENQCKRYISSYPDSSFSIEVLQKLYYSTIMTDSVNHKTGLLKTYYETLIQNNQSNIALIKRAFYLIQKCNVKLGQYTSALEGFQIIIQSNPYSWEGLLASWDYAATMLKAGQGGAERNIQTTNKNETILLNSDENLDTLINRLKTKEGYDKKAFNPENRKKFYGNIQSALNEEKLKQEEQIRELKEIKENKERGINQENGSRESKIRQLEGNLAELEALHKTVKVKKPSTIKELNTIIQSDIRSINKVKSSNSGDIKKSLIPKDYSLSQNYPNPFNPVTKISFALPKESKVKLIIYDMLGREVARLINNENLSAGTHIREFNGSNLASGVYFLRLLINDGKDFTDVKKIVLLK